MFSHKLELWIAFGCIIAVLLALDLLVLHRKAHAVRAREAALWSVVWVSISLIFNAGVWWLLGTAPALEFFTGYLIEKSLSVDNLFVFLVIFRYFQVDGRYQHRVLFWGVFGAIVLRTVLILAGVALVHRFRWILYLFGAMLVYSGIKLLLSKGEVVDPENNLALRIARRLLPMSERIEGQHFLVKQGGRRLATPLLLVLVTVELSDVLFALDSIPAVFGITGDPFIILTSNIFAILGLRALYFLLASFLGRIRYLSTGLALVLAFIGAKMVVAEWWEIPTGISLAVVGTLLIGFVGASIVADRREKRVDG